MFRAKRLSILDGSDEVWDGLPMSWAKLLMSSIVRAKFRRFKMGWEGGGQGTVSRYCGAALWVPRVLGWELKGQSPDTVGSACVHGGRAFAIKGRSGWPGARQLTALPPCTLPSMSVCALEGAN